MSDLLLRPVTSDDIKLLFEWANDPVAREVARTQGSISWSDHCTWFSGKLATPQTRMWIAQQNGKPVGQIRLDAEGDIAEIDISVAPTERNKGIGRAILSALSLCHLPGARFVSAFVRKENLPSAKVFRNAGFLDSDAKIEGGYFYFLKDLGNG